MNHSSDPARFVNTFLPYQRNGSHRESLEMGAFAHLLEALEQFGVAGPAGQSEAMRILAHIFRADAAGLYLIPQPGRPMELVDGFQFPAGAPRRLGIDILMEGEDYPRSITQAHALDAHSGVWSQAAQEAEWQEMLIYTLPRCPARLVLAYAGPAPRLAADLVKAALYSLAGAIRHRQTLNQVEALRQQNDELECAVTAGINNAQAGIVLLDGEGRVTTCNPRCRQLLGYAADEIVGLPAEGVLVSRSDVSQLVHQVLSGHSSLEDHYLTLYQRYGDPLPVRLWIVPLRMAGRPMPHGAAVFFTDRCIEQMDLMESNLSQKNVQLERMISILAHEIRNPLGSIQAGLDYLEPTLGHDEEMSQALKTIQNEIRRMDRLLGDALLVSRPSELQTRPQCITDLLDDLLAGRAKLFDERGISARREYQPDLPLAPIDRDQMEQVFDNLIVNAIHAMSDGGQLFVEVSATTAPSGDPYKRLPVLEIKVGDSGSGIPPENLERIFDPFFTTKQGGTGLGLAVARRIVGQHNGALQVESWLGIGTLFTITLPAEEKSRD